jgi:hypothetical protein
MPIRTTPTSPEHRALERRCDGCGSTNAPYGTGRLSDALRTGDPSKVKCWCGPDGCVKSAETGKAA